MPAAQLVQKQVGIMTRLVDVMQHDRSAYFARIVDDQIAKPHQALGNAGGDSYILDFAEGDVSRSAGNEPGVNLHFCVGQRVTDHVASEMKVSGNQKQRESQRN